MFVIFYHIFLLLSSLFCPFDNFFASFALIYQILSQVGLLTQNIPYFVAPNPPDYHYAVAVANQAAVYLQHIFERICYSRYLRCIRHALKYAVLYPKPVILQGLFYLAPEFGARYVV